MATEKQWYTTAEVADAVGLSVAWVRHYAAEMGMGVKIGRNWAYTADDIERIRQRPDLRKRPRRSESEDQNGA